ncbi:DUF6183 family protein [Streptomyces sp. 147326]|uniref:DUF6183 family protein n=1 Tax=Streptomyces sp. 147326 TaxID=3074379 RepID=UPI003857D1EE
MAQANRRAGIRRRVRWVGDLAVAASARTAAGQDASGRCETILAYAHQALAAHPGPESLRTLLRVPASPYAENSGRIRSERRLASLVAHGHRIEDIARLVFARESGSVHSREFAACLLHELVLVSDRVEEHPAMVSFAGTLRSEGHPLAEPPSHLLPEEQQGLRRPADAADDWTWTVHPSPVVSYEAAELHTTPEMRQRAAGIDMTETSLPELAETVGAVVRHWRDQSNGEIAAQEFWSPDPVAPEDFPAVFEQLPLIPWPADGAPARLHPSTPGEVLRILLTAAVRAPAYGLGPGGAYGRLAARRSLGGLAGAPTDAPITHTAELVRQTRWFCPDAVSSMWFHEVAWDLAVAALRPGGPEIVVLAATDTD